MRLMCTATASYPCLCSCMVRPLLALVFIVQIYTSILYMKRQITCVPEHCVLLAAGVALMFVVGVTAVYLVRCGDRAHCQ